MKNAVKSDSERKHTWLLTCSQSLTTFSCTKLKAAVSARYDRILCGYRGRSRPKVRGPPLPPSIVPSYSATVMHKVNYSTPKVIPYPILSDLHPIIQPLLMITKVTNYSHSSKAKVSNLFCFLFASHLTCDIILSPTFHIPDYASPRTHWPAHCKKKT